MMKTCRYTLCTILAVGAGVCAAGAHDRDSVALFRAIREHESPVAVSLSEPHANPALRAEAYVSSLSEVSVGYELRREGQPPVQAEGDGADFGRFAAHSHRLLSDRSTVWGHAGYARGDKRDVRWNSSSDYALLYPFVTADSIGGDLTSEEYAFGGGYGRRGGRLGWGVEANVRALHEYRAVDPRPRNRTTDIDARAGAAARVGRYRAALAVGLRIYKQQGSVSFYNPLGRSSEFQLSGLASAYTRFNGADASLYNGRGCRAAVSLVPADAREGFVLGASYEGFGYDKQLTAHDHLPLQALRSRTWRARAGWLRDVPGSLFWSLSADGSYAYRRGDESIVDEKVSNAYEILGKLTTFGCDRWRGRAEALVGRSAARAAWSLSGWAEYLDEAIDYLHPSQRQALSGVRAGADFGYRRQWARCLLRMEAGASYRANLDAELLLPVANLRPSLVEMATRDYDRRRLDALSCRLKLRADCLLGRNLALSLSADYALTRYADCVLGHAARIACGIVF